MSKVYLGALKYLMLWGPHKLCSQVNAERSYHQNVIAILEKLHSEVRHIHTVLAITYEEECFNHFLKAEKLVSYLFLIFGYNTDAPLDDSG